ncbi:MAG: hypothetical protein LUH10_02065 [Tannerellaceae bacterium]|nr:hypothetical protein [Tannerellaceae bacterium]
MKKKIVLSIFLILPFALMAQQLEVPNPAVEEVNADGLSIQYSLDKNSWTTAITVNNVMGGLGRYIYLRAVGDGFTDYTWEYSGATSNVYWGNDLANGSRIYFWMSDSSTTQSLTWKLTARGADGVGKTVYAVLGITK